MVLIKNVMMFKRQNSRTVIFHSEYCIKTYFIVICNSVDVEATQNAKRYHGNILRQI